MARNFQHCLRVRYGECDPQGIVFNANYLLYVDVAFTELWREAVGPWQQMTESGFDAVVAESRLRFRAPARFDDEIAVGLACLIDPVPAAAAALGLLYLALAAFVVMAWRLPEPLPSCGCMGTDRDPPPHPLHAAVNVVLAGAGVLGALVATGIVASNLAPKGDTAGRGQIAVEGAVAVAKVRELSDNHGLDASTGEYVDLFKAGVVDPAKVTRSAVQNAVSIASLLLTTETLVVDKPEEEDAGTGAGGGHGHPHGMGM